MMTKPAGARSSIMSEIIDKIHRMKHFFIFFAFTLSAALAQPDKYHELALEGMAQGHNLQIEKAEEIFNSMIALEPNHPLGCLALALTNLYGHQFEKNQEAFEQKFKDYTETAIKLARKNLSSQSRPVEALFHLGVGHVFWAFYHGERNNLLRALWYGKQGLDCLEQVVASDTSYYDAYLGIGAFHHEKKNYVEAIATFNKILALKNLEEKGIAPRAHFNLGNCHREMGDMQKAEAEYEIAYQYDDGWLRLQIDKAREKAGGKFLQN